MKGKTYYNQISLIYFYSASILTKCDTHLQEHSGFQIIEAGL